MAEATAGRERGAREHAGMREKQPLEEERQSRAQPLHLLQRL